MAPRGAVVWMVLACVSNVLWISSGQSDSHASYDEPKAGEYGDYAVHRSQLHNALLQAYDRRVLPKMPVNVSYSLTLTQIDGVDEKDNLLRISVWASSHWSDHRLVWDPDTFGGVRSLALDTKYCWLPGLRANAHVLDAEEVLVTVMSDGSMVHVQPLKLAVYCPFNFANYPYDTQVCDLRVESWSHNMQEINVDLPGKGGVDLASFMEHSVWGLMNTSATRTETLYACCPETFVSLNFKFTIRRRTGGYAARVVAPSVLTSLLVLACYLLPPSRGERVVFTAVLLLCLLLQLLHLNLTVPLSDTGTPYLAHFLCFGVFLAFFACVESVLVHNLSRGFWGDEAVGRQEAGGGEFQVSPAKPNTPVTRIARILDVIFFILFTIIFAIVGAVLLNPKSTE